MNERIKELEAQCWEPKQFGPPWFNSQKFAELIVRECAEVAANVVVEHEGVDFGLVEKCYEHFGVES